MIEQLYHYHNHTMKYGGVKNGKYQHLVNNVSFPSYYWSKDKLKKLTDLGVEARGIFTILKVL